MRGGGDQKHRNRPTKIEKTVALISSNPKIRVLPGLEHKALTWAADVLRPDHAGEAEHGEERGYDLLKPAAKRVWSLSRPH